MDDAHYGGIIIDYFFVRHSVGWSEYESGARCIELFGLRPNLANGAKHRGRRIL